MAQYVSGRQPFLNVGIPGITTNTPVLDITGRVGIGTTNPTADLDLSTLRIRQSIFDVNNFSGNLGYFLTKDATGLKWVEVPPINTNAILVAEDGNILGVSSFIGINIRSNSPNNVSVSTNTDNTQIANINIDFDWIKTSDNSGLFTSKNIGIGTTNPTSKLWVDGDGRFTGVVTANEFKGLSGFVTSFDTTNLKVSGISTFVGLATFTSVGIGTTAVIGSDVLTIVGNTRIGGQNDIFRVGNGITMSNGIITATTFSGKFLDFEGIIVSGIATINTGIVTSLTVSGVTTINSGIVTSLRVSGIATINTGIVTSLTVSGVTTINTGIVTSLTVSGVTTINTGIVTNLSVSGVTTINSGIVTSLRVSGIATINTGIVTSLTVSGVTTINTGIVTSLTVSGVTTINTGIVTNLSVSGVTTINTGIVTSLRVSGISTFVGLATFTSVGIGTIAVIGSDKLTIIGDTRIGGQNDIFRVGNAITMSSGIITATTFSGKFLDFENIIVAGIATINTGIVTSLRVSGISTFVGLATFTSVGIGTIAVIGSDKLTIIGDTRIGGQNDIFRVGNAITMSSGIITATTFSGNFLEFVDISVSGIASINTGIVTSLSVSGIATINSGIVTSLSVSGVTTINTGIVTNLSVSGVTTINSGIVTSLRVSGIATINTGIVTSLSVSGVTTINTGIVTSLTVSGIASINTGIVTSLTVSGIATINTGIVTSLTVSGVTTINTGIITSLSVSGIASINTGIITSLSVSGISTFVGLATFTSVGIGTTNTTSKLWVDGDGYFVGVVTASNFYVGTQLVGGSISGTDIVGTALSISGISTFGNTSIGIKIDGTTGIITSNTGTAVTFFGNLTGTASTASFATTAFSLQGFNINTTTVGFATTATNLGAGNTGSLPFQNSPGITSFLSAPETPNQVLIYDTGTNKPKWGSVTENGGAINGITVRDEGTNTFNTITTLDIFGNNITATSDSAGIASIRVSDNLVGTALSISGISTFGNSTTGIKIDGTTGIITSNTGTAVTFVGNLSGTASTASFAGTAFSLQGFNLSTSVVGFATTATNLGAGNTGSLPYQKASGITTFLDAPAVSDQVLLYDTNLKAPKWSKVGLGTNTTGNYVKEIYGTTGEIQLTPSATGAGVTHKIGFVQNPTIQGTLQVNQDLNIFGNLSIGGTINRIIVQDLVIENKDIVLGFTTVGFGITIIEVSTDFTANGGGIAIASTIGTPLVNLNSVGFESNPPTYKKIMWFGAAGGPAGTAFAGLATDAWLSNYAFGIGTTAMSNGTRFAAGNVTIGQDDITAVRNINSTGISTFGNSTTGIKIDGTTGIITSNTGTAVTFFGNLTGTASTASFAGTAFSLQGFNSSTTIVGFATTATNLANGSQGSLPYQNSSGITSFLDATTTPDQVLVYDTGTNKPKWAPVTGTGAISGITINNDPNTDASRFLLFTDATSGTVGSQNVSSTKLVFNPSSGSLGIGTTSPSTPLQVDRYGVKTVFGTFVATAGITTDIDAFRISTTNFKTAEYTVHIQSSSSIQAQKVLVMQNGTSAFSQEYAIMYEPTFMVSIGATVSGTSCKLQFTPESGISGLMTYRFTRETML